MEKVEGKKKKGYRGFIYQAITTEGNQGYATMQTPSVTLIEMQGSWAGIHQARSTIDWGLLLGY